MNMAGSRALFASKHKSFNQQGILCSRDVDPGWRAERGGTSDVVVAKVRARVGTSAAPRQRFPKRASRRRGNAQRDEFMHTVAAPRSRNTVRTRAAAER